MNCGAWISAFIHSSLVPYAVSWFSRSNLSYGYWNLPIRPEKRSRPPYRFQHVISTVVKLSQTCRSAPRECQLLCRMLGGDSQMETSCQSRSNAQVGGQKNKDFFWQCDWSVKLAANPRVRHTAIYSCRCLSCLCPSPIVCNFTDSNSFVTSCFHRRRKVHSNVIPMFDLIHCIIEPLFILEEIEHLVYGGLPSIGD